MKFRISAALAALISAPSLCAQSAAPAPSANVEYLSPMGGSWSYAFASDGSQATFLDAAARPQLTVHCTRAARQVTIAKPATAAAPFLIVWTSSLTRNLPSSFNPATGRLSATLSAFDPLLDALAFSRGRIGVTVTGLAPLVVPAWAELARVVEDCRV
jgi:hypothetical protein